MYRGSGEGICAVCERPGEVGSPCSNAVCRQRGYCYIPLAYRPAAGTAPESRIGQLWDNYLLVEKLGEGGVGSVFRALQQPIMLEAALKIVSADAHTALAERFRDEAAALARLNHPHIVRLMHFGERRGEPFLVMELVPGARTLAQAAAAGITIDRLFDILGQLVDALEAAHLVGVIHRDIKPANVMLQSLPNRPDFVRLVDFGLVKFIDSGASTQISAGTPSYMAPEQIERSGIGPWTDWYAFGCIALQVLSGAPPYGDASTMEIVRLKSHPDHRPTDHLVAAFLPTTTRQALSQLVAHNPEARAKDGDSVRALLERARLGMEATYGLRTICHPGWLSSSSQPVNKHGGAAATPFDGNIPATLRLTPRNTVIDSLAGVYPTQHGSAGMPIPVMPDVASTTRATSRDHRPSLDERRATRHDEPTPRAPAGLSVRPALGATSRAHVDREPPGRSTAISPMSKRRVSRPLMVSIAVVAVVAASLLLFETRPSLPVDDRSLVTSAPAEVARADDPPSAVLADVLPPPVAHDATLATEGMILDSGLRADLEVTPPLDKATKPASGIDPCRALVNGLRALDRLHLTSAQRDLKRGLDCSGRYGEALMGLAEVEFQRTNRAEALEYVSEALRFEPRNVRYLTFQGQLLRKQGAHLKACEAWARALAVNRGAQPAKNHYRRYCALVEPVSLPKTENSEEN